MDNDVTQRALLHSNCYYEFHVDTPECSQETRMGQSVFPSCIAQGRLELPKMEILNAKPAALAAANACYEAKPTTANLNRLRISIIYDVRESVCRYMYSSGRREGGICGMTTSLHLKSSPF
jgi:hypothetical protein